MHHTGAAEPVQDRRRLGCFHSRPRCPPSPTPVILLLTAASADSFYARTIRSLQVNAAAAHAFVWPPPPSPSQTPPSPPPQHTDLARARSLNLRQNVFEASRGAREGQCSARGQWGAEAAASRRQVPLGRRRRRTRRRWQTLTLATAPRFIPVLIPSVVAAVKRIYAKNT